MFEHLGFDAEHEIHLALGDLNAADEKLSSKPELQKRIWSWIRACAHPRGVLANNETVYGCDFAGGEAEFKKVGARFISDARRTES